MKGGDWRREEEQTSTVEQKKRSGVGPKQGKNREKGKEKGWMGGRTAR